MRETGIVTRPPACLLVGFALFIADFAAKIGCVLFELEGVV